MSLSPSQLATLKAAILLDPALAALTSGPDTDYGAIAAAMNLSASPDFWVYRSSLSRHELITQSSQDGTSFTWGGTTGGYISRSPGERDAFREMFNDSGAVDPAQANIQAGFADIFSGPGAGAQNNRAHIAAMSRRKATRAEKALATGMGSTGTPAKLGWEGQLAISDIGEMFNA